MNAHRKRQYASTSLLLLAACILSGQASDAQEIFEFNLQPQSMADMKVSQRKNYQLQIDLAIDDLERTANLSPQQKRKLQIAGKGAVEAALEQWTKQVVQPLGPFMQPVPMPLDNGAGPPAFAEPTADEDAEVKEAEKDQEARPLSQPAIPDNQPPKPITPERVHEEGVDQTEVEPRGDLAPNQVANEGNIGPLIQGNAIQLDLGDDAFEDFVFEDFGFPMLMPQNGNIVTNNPIWTKAVEKTLTEQQIQKVQLAKRNRHNFLLNSQVDQTLAQLDTAILLSDAQRQAIRPLIKKHVGDRLANQANANFSQFISPMQQLRTVLRHVPIQVVQKHLSETQLKQWKELLARPNMGGFNIPIPPIQPPIPVQPVPN